MQEMQVQSLGWEDPLEKGMATPVFLPGEFHDRPARRLERSWRGDPEGLSGLHSRMRHRAQRTWALWREEFSPQLSNWAPPPHPDAALGSSNVLVLG